MASMWDYYHDLDNFNKEDHPLGDRRKILKWAYDDNFINNRSYGWMINHLIEKMTGPEAQDLVEHFLSRMRKGSLSQNDSLPHTIKLLTQKGVDSPVIRKFLNNSSSKQAHRALLFLDPYSLEEEELGLRAISANKHCPHPIASNKYAPRLAALKKLPPVTRLKALEALTKEPHTSYNVFVNIPSLTEFKQLLFGTVLKYTSRVDALCEKYTELTSMGKVGKITVNNSCENCGDFSISLTSTRVRTETGMSSTHLGEFLSQSRCILCGRWTKHPPRFVKED